MLNTADERLLSYVYALMRNYTEHGSTIIGHTMDGKPLTGAELLRLVEESRYEGLQGKVITPQEILTQMGLGKL